MVKLATMKQSDFEQKPPTRESTIPNQLAPFAPRLTPPKLKRRSIIPDSDEEDDVVARPPRESTIPNQLAPFASQHNPHKLKRRGVVPDSDDEDDVVASKHKKTITRAPTRQPPVFPSRSLAQPTKKRKRTQAPLKAAPNTLDGYFKPKQASNDDVIEIVDEMSGVQTLEAEQASNDDVIEIVDEMSGVRTTDAKEASVDDTAMISGSPEEDHPMPEHVMMYKTALNQGRGQHFTNLAHQLDLWDKLRASEANSKTKSAISLSALVAMSVNDYSAASGSGGRICTDHDLPPAYINKGARWMFYSASAWQKARRKQWLACSVADRNLHNRAHARFHWDGYEDVMPVLLISDGTTRQLQFNFPRTSDITLHDARSTLPFPFIIHAGGELYTGTIPDLLTPRGGFITGLMVESTKNTVVVNWRELKGTKWCAPIARGDPVLESTLLSWLASQAVKKPSMVRRWSELLGHQEEGRREFKVGLGTHGRNTITASNLPKEIRELLLAEHDKLEGRSTKGRGVEGKWTIVYDKNRESLQQWSKEDIARCGKALLRIRKSKQDGGKAE